MNLPRPVVFLLIALAALPASGLLQSCHKVPYTGRRQVLFVPEGRENALGAASYKDILSEEKVSSNASWSNLVKQVGQRVAKVTGEKDYAWEFKLIDSETQNAFCLPGGKVAFYEGIMPTCANEGGVAVVMGHEIAHAIARHGGERMSQNILVQMGAMGIQIATRDESQQKQLILLGAYGAAANLGYVLPFGRKQESEADHIGLLFMAMAGYDPEEAPRFWGRMDAEGGKQPPAFLSTHPSHEKRKEELQQLMPEAKKLYAAAKQRYGTGDAITGSSSGGSKSEGSKSEGSKSEGSSSGGSKGEPTQKGKKK